MAEQQNWQRYGPFDLGMQDYMEDFELDFREEFWNKFPALDLVPLDHTQNPTQLGKLYTPVYATYMQRNCHWNHYYAKFNAGGTQSTREKENEVPVIELDDDAVERFVDQQKTRTQSERRIQTWKLGTDGVKSMGRRDNSRTYLQLRPSVRPLLCVSPQEGWLTVRTGHTVIFPTQYWSSSDQKISTRHTASSATPSFLPPERSWRQHGSISRVRGKATSPMLLTLLRWRKWSNCGKKVPWGQVTLRLSSRRCGGSFVPTWEPGDRMSTISSDLVICRSRAHPTELSSSNSPVSVEQRHGQE